MTFKAGQLRQANNRFKELIFLIKKSGKLSWDVWSSLNEFSKDPVPETMLEEYTYFIADLEK